MKKVEPWMEMQVKPKIRWWLPGAFMEKKELEQEIEDLVAAGYGGAEILYFMGIPSNDIKMSFKCEGMTRERWEENEVKLDYATGNPVESAVRVKGMK